MNNINNIISLIKKQYSSNKSIDIYINTTTNKIAGLFYAIGTDSYIKYLNSETHNIKVIKLPFDTLYKCKDYLNDCFYINDDINIQVTNDVISINVDIISVSDYYDTNEIELDDFKKVTLKKNERLLPFISTISRADNCYYYIFKDNKLYSKLPMNAMYLCSVNDIIECDNGTIIPKIAFMPLFYTLSYFDNDINIQINNDHIKIKNNSIDIVIDSMQISTEIIDKINDECDRYINFMYDKVKQKSKIVKLDKKEISEIKSLCLAHDIQTDAVIKDNIMTMGNISCRIGKSDDCKISEIVLDYIESDKCDYQISIYDNGTNNGECTNIYHVQKYKDGLIGSITLYD